MDPESQKMIAWLSSGWAGCCGREALKLRRRLRQCCRGPWSKLEQVEVWLAVAGPGRDPETEAGPQHQADKGPVATAPPRENYILAGVPNIALHSQHPCSPL